MLRHLQSSITKGALHNQQNTAPVYDQDDKPKSKPKLMPKVVQKLGDDSFSEMPEDSRI